MKQLQDETILLTAAEDIFNYVLPENTEILQGVPDTVSNAQSQKIEKEPDKNPEIESETDEDVDFSNPEIIRLGSADTGWFLLPEDIEGRYNIIKKAATALSQTLNEIRDKISYQRQKKLITVRTRCFFKYAPEPDEIIDPAKTRPDSNAVKLTVRHTLRTE